MAADALRRLVEDLCTDEMAGRAPGTPGGIAARDLVRSHFTDLGLTPMGEDGFDQPIPAMDGSNLIGAIPGSTDRWVILSAHYDHIGEQFGETFWGADDNASGIAVLMETAHRLVDLDGERGVLVCAWDAEEPPWFLTPGMGSQWWVDHPTVVLDTVDLMVCLDIVGHRLGTTTPDEVGSMIFMQGAELTTGLTELADGIPSVPGIAPRHIPDWAIPPMSDHDAFREAEIPFLFYTCGRSIHYHQPTDQPDTLDYEKMAAFVEHLTLFVQAARGAELAWAEKPGPDAAILDTMQEIGDIVLGGGVDLAEQLGITLSAEDGYVAREDRMQVSTLLISVESMLGG